MPQPSAGDRDYFSSPRSQLMAIKRAEDEPVFLDDETTPDQPSQSASKPPPPAPENVNTHTRGEPSDASTAINGESHPPPARSWLDRLNPQLILENSGSVARDNLANERTWLAYVRTSLAVASTGVALVQLFTIKASQTPVDPGTPVARIQQFARPLGATTVILGLLVLLLGTTRYFRIQLALVKGVFPPARMTVGFVSVVLCLLVAVVFGILVSVRR
ncbi:hypothetical protein BOTBODRAFT_38000 [Botryobasidium botryosum FD-172 SS1]|uniref:DUF202 domain-containing protein n=1 Tax=Botryobasidium botryosum (strain FD-172 SS1) TaxID=930990 RepID=A0A067M8Y4_BOTB1|nr:hypothetical protein BOTBODRAFT_38000 [Botryobasidium botryosum FD-172 SS1]